MNPNDYIEVIDIVINDRKYVALIDKEDVGIDHNFLRKKYEERIVLEHWKEIIDSMLTHKLSEEFIRQIFEKEIQKEEPPNLSNMRAPFMDNKVKSVLKKLQELVDLIQENDSRTISDARLFSKGYFQALETMDKIEKTGKFTPEDINEMNIVWKINKKRAFLDEDDEKTHLMLEVQERLRWDGKKQFETCWKLMLSHDIAKTKDDAMTKVLEIADEMGIADDLL